MKIDTKTTSEIQRHITNDGKTLHEINPENDFSRDKESIRLKGQPTRTDPKTPFENHREITTHGKTTHETKHENDFSRDTGSTRLKGQPTKTDTKTTFEIWRTNWTFLIMRRQLTKPTTHTIFRETKNRYT